ncbi:hypothetical protein LAZ67_2005869 [Cordylochernes scorpioides]|uniref:DUF5641 domain-containing protein n=1 Tax=Cordylochernes scorpioides TaxID=51811 RepID=A0ABY6K4Z6_9ARAC|nr:hypothetical protein LAZ67_2005869 [Cordylochernes scorpioides]
MVPNIGTAFSSRPGWDAKCRVQRRSAQALFCPDARSLLFWSRGGKKTVTSIRVNWPLARVVEVYPGRDGPVRVAKLRTSKGVQIRPVQRLYNLEIPADLGSTLRSIQSEPRRGGSRGEASKDPTKIAQS